MFLPSGIPKYYIYDVFHSDKNIVIIMAAEIVAPIIKLNNQIMQLITCPHKHTYIYKVQSTYIKQIKLQINDESFNVKVNKYPEFPNEIIMSTIVKNEDDYIEQWIKYHSKLGIQKFIIYDNTPINNRSLDKILSNYNNVLLIKWPYSYRLPISGLSGQTTHQNHSIYAFRNSKYIAFFDVDEYINPQTDEKLNEILDKHASENISSLRILNKCFYNPDELPTENGRFLKIFNCDPICVRGREKNFAIPRNVETFSVHMVTKGLPMKTIMPNILFFNHYMFLNKDKRGRDKTDLIDKSILKNL